MDVAILIAQTCLTAFLAAWLTVGVRDNIFHPSMNEIFTSQVLELQRMEHEAPMDFALIQHRRIQSRKIQRTLFWFIVFAEFVVSVALWIGVAWMALAVVGVTDAETAKSIAIIAALGFTSIWASMLVAGNHFAYWYFHEWAQSTHFQLSYWGIGAMIFLATA
ncbi:MAG: DUF2165 family protein [Pseudomonadota bacterium]